ncbi:aldo/keto reductase [Mangrovihabitans endophyticus]|uniref:aldo/keto reductase n=1 Tax=Mangrovihabitans endophyticus TaxID=1751298 RepID=UPI001662CE3F|nr:aldo/keto reductase [Mangrovihabitans endophyticus]
MERATVREVTIAPRVTMPRLGFGTFKLNDAAATAVLAAAIDAGYRLFDTGDRYGNEPEVGRAVRGSGIPLEEFVVATKCYGPAGYDAVRRAFDASAQRLGVDRVDLYMLHWPREDPDETRGAWRAMEELLAENRVRAIGVANHGIADLERLLRHATVPPAVNQIEVHPWCAREEQRVAHDRLGIVTQAWGPLGRGRGLLASAGVLSAIGAKHGRTAAQIALRWQVQLGLVPIPKSADPRRMAENLDVFDFELDAGDLAEIARLDTGQLVGPVRAPW